MADPRLSIEVQGLRQLQDNLAAFGSDKIVGRIIRASLAAGRAHRTHARRGQCARLGLGLPRSKEDGHGHESPRYGRIPRSIKAGRAYIPKSNRSEYRLNIVARGQRGPGIYKNKAPHAHFIEYGAVNWRTGRRSTPRPFLGPALETTAAEVTEKIRDTMARRIDAEKFKL
jgi:hypothetical protein